MIRNINSINVILFIFINIIPIWFVFINAAISSNHTMAYMKNSNWLSEIHTLNIYSHETKTSCFFSDDESTVFSEINLIIKQVFFNNEKYCPCSDENCCEKMNSTMKFNLAVAVAVGIIRIESKELLTSDLNSTDPSEDINNDNFSRMFVSHFRIGIKSLPREITSTSVLIDLILCNMDSESVRNGVAKLASNLKNGKEFLAEFKSHLRLRILQRIEVDDLHHADFERLIASLSLLVHSDSDEVIASTSSFLPSSTTPPAATSTPTPTATSPTSSLTSCSLVIATLEAVHESIMSVCVCGDRPYEACVGVDVRIYERLGDLCALLQRGVARCLSLPTHTHAHTAGSPSSSVSSLAGAHNHALSLEREGGRGGKGGCGSSSEQTDNFDVQTWVMRMGGTNTTLHFTPTTSFFSFVTCEL